MCRDDSFVCRDGSFAAETEVHDPEMDNRSPEISILFAELRFQLFAMETCSALWPCQTVVSITQSCP